MAAAIFSMAGLPGAAQEMSSDNDNSVSVSKCPKWGKGFFYVPGTSTCLQVGGVLKLDVAKGDVPGYGLGSPDSSHSRNEFALKFDARTETGFGTIRVYAEPTFAKDNASYLKNSDHITLPFAYVTFGSVGVDGLQLRLGLNDTLFRTIGGMTALHVFNAGFTHAPTTVSQAVISYGSGGWYGSVALESEEKDAIVSSDANFVAGLSYTSSWGAVRGAVARDSSEDAWSAKIKLEHKYSPDTSFYFMGAYSSEGISNNFYRSFSGNRAFWIGGTHRINEKIEGLLQVSMDGFGESHGKRKSILAGLQYQISDNVYLKPEAAYMRSDTSNELAGVVRLYMSF